MKEAEILRSAASELGKYIDDVNAKLKAGIESTDLDDPDYHDYQTPHELVVIAKQYEALQAELDATNAKIDRLTSRGIEDMKYELDAFMAHINEMYEVMDALKPYNVMQRTMVMELRSKAPAQSLAGIQSQAVTDLITECSYSTQVNGIATSIIDVDSAISYADRLGEG